MVNKIWQPTRSISVNFNEFLNQAWNDHATQSPHVAARIADGLKLINQGDQIPQMAQLVTHVFGEHLGQWDDGIKTLQLLKQAAVFEIGSEGDMTIARSIASLELAGGKRSSVADLSVSDQIRVLAVAASALSEQKKSDQAQALFRNALETAQHSSLPKEDPANRALAVTGNNLACALEEKSSRNSAETEFMILAAKTARKYWEIAGTWLQIERAEYRLSQTFLKAGDLARSLEHARVCLEIIQKNNAPALEFLFGYEALALVEKALGNLFGFSEAVAQAKSYFEKLSDSDKSWCKSTIEKLS
jgi:hypothetical protein